MRHLTGLHKRLNSRLDKAVWEHKMIGSGDRVLICVSGGADSLVLLTLLRQRIDIYAPDVGLHALYVDMGFGEHAGERIQKMSAFFDSLEIPATVLETHIGEIAHRRDVKVRPCFLCSKIRRKKIFETAEKNACNRIAFGHHKDDVVETLLLNMIFSRELSSMVPNLPVKNGRFSIIRPLYYVEEKMIKNFCVQASLPVIDQECPMDGVSRRHYVKELVQKLEKDHRGSRENLFKSLKHVKVDYLFGTSPFK